MGRVLTGTFTSNLAFASRPRRTCQDTRKPALHGRSHRRQIGLQAVVARHRDHRPLHRGRWNPKTVTRPLHDQDRDRHLVELAETARRRRSRPRATGRLERKRQAHHADRPSQVCGPAGHPGTRGATADQQRQSVQLVLAQPGNDREPGGVELACRGRRAASGDAVRLLDQRDAHILPARSGRRRHEISRRHPSPGPVAENERRARLIDRVQVRPRPPVDGLQLERSDPGDAASSTRSLRSSEDETPAMPRRHVRAGAASFARAACRRLSGRGATLPLSRHGPAATHVR
jgi:hypothetical protein